MHNNQFQTGNADFYVSIATQIGIAVQNASLYASMENLATRDGLTGIYNRRYFNQLFNDYVTQAMDQRLPIAVALFDIDKFKNVNDTYGHSFGDTVIISVSHTANEVVEEHGGILGRYGGEEFMMAFLGKTIDDILPIIRTIHERIKNTELIHNEQVVHINVSIGVTDYPATCSNPADLLNHADWAMYYSKQHGRGRITIDGEQVRSESLLQ
jgi:diguanylate cyclase (GGDEF)-like protein